MLHSFIGYHSNIVKISTLKGTYKFSTIYIKSPMLFFAEIKKSILKFIWNLKRPQIVKTILKKKNIGGLRGYKGANLW